MFTRKPTFKDLDNATEDSWESLFAKANHNNLYYIRSNRLKFSALTRERAQYEIIRRREEESTGIFQIVLDCLRFLYCILEFLCYIISIIGTIFSLFDL